MVNKNFGWNKQEMIDLSGKILDGHATELDKNSLADMVLKFFGEVDELIKYVEGCNCRKCLMVFYNGIKETLG